MRNLLVLLFILCFVAIGFLYAAPVDVPTVVQGLEGNIFKNKESGIGLSVAAEVDLLTKRKLNVADDGGNAKVKGQFYVGKIILTLLNKLDIYGILGKAENLEYKDSYSKFKPEGKFTWGAGLSMPIWEWQNYDIKFFADGKYRAVNNIDYGSNYERTSLLSGVAGAYSNYTAPKLLTDWQEWQVAFGATKRFKYFMPYLGIKYSDFRESNKVSSANSDTIVGLFVGCSIIPIKALSIDFQGRFIDETAFAIKATYKF